MSALRQHLIDKHHFDADDEILVGDEDDLGALHRDVHDDERMDGEENHDVSHLSTTIETSQGRPA